MRSKTGILPTTSPEKMTDIPADNCLLESVVSVEWVRKIAVGVPDSDSCLAKISPCFWAPPGAKFGRIMRAETAFRLTGLPAAKRGICQGGYRGPKGSPAGLFNVGSLALNCYLFLQVWTR